MSHSRPSNRLPVLVAAGLVADGLRLRRRLAALPTLAPSEEPVGDGMHFVTAEGVVLDETTRRAAAAHARDRKLAVLDLVPADLSVEAALGLARAVNPVTYRTNRLALGRGAGHALLVTADVLDRIGADETEGLDPVQMVRLTTEAKRCAPADADLAVAAGLRALPVDLGKRRAALEALGFPAIWAVAPSVARHALLGLGVLADPVWGVSALVAHWAQPYLILGGSPVRPCDRRTGLTRPLREPYIWIRSLRGRWCSPVQRQEAAKRAAARDRYAADLAAGVERFFEPRRTDCPWCDGDDLAGLLKAPDLFQHKPGVFRLERCRGCGHVFQNPRLTPDGLEFYYRDFYDGAGTAFTDRCFCASGPAYHGRARMLAPFTTPKRWLDVGTGHGHFCLAAREFWPETVFDGLDMSEAVSEAERRGWVDRGWRGFFPDLAGELAGRYDLISMHHYLEHTREPYAELDAAAKVLPPGGFLLIEVPDPEWPLAHLLGRYWEPWLQPQHLHLYPIANLSRALAERGLTVVAADRGRAHMPIDFALAAALFLFDRIPHSDAPWSFTPATPLRRVRQAGVVTAGLPLVAVGMVADALVTGAVQGGGSGNCYRVLARKGDGRV